jgi:LmbE family N-acetylglucosaminyl deacetylase
MAVELLGAGKNSVVRLHLPDSKVADHETNLENLLASLITADDLVVAPWDLDSHPDHEACGRAAQKVAQRTGAELIFYLFWTWHHKEPVALAGKNLLRFALDTQLQAAKWAALQCHRTQLQYEKGEPILPEKLLGPAKRPFEIFIMG